MNNTQESLGAALPKFIQHLEDKGRSPSTVLAYGSDLEQLINYLTDHNIAVGDQVTVVASTNLRGVTTFTASRIEVLNVQ